MKCLDPCPADTYNNVQYPKTVANTTVRISFYCCFSVRIAMQTRLFWLYFSLLYLIWYLGKSHWKLWNVDLLCWQWVPYCRRQSNCIFFPLPWPPHRSICPVTLLSRSLVNSLVNVLMACGKRFKVTVQQPMAGSTRLLYFCVWLWSLVWFLLSLFVNVLMVILQPWIRVWSPRVRRFTSISFSFSLFFRDMVMFDSTSEKLI